MNQILFQFVIFISKLPLWVLYFFSDIFYYLNYYIVGYRKKVVYENLKNSFPEKSEKEIKSIEKAFFRNFGDFMMETLKNFSITEKELEKLVQYKNLELYEKAYQEKKNVIILTGHNFNWELAISFQKYIPQENFYVIYKKLASEFWDKKVIDSRAQFGVKLLETRDAMRHLATDISDGNAVYGFIADQSPNHDKIQTGVIFLNQKTPVLTGYNRIPNKENLVFCYAEITKIKRGKYQIEYLEITPKNGEQFIGEELVVTFNKMLEKTIIEHPSNWLWTHKKWKNSGLLKEEHMQN